MEVIMNMFKKLTIVTLMVMSAGGATVQAAGQKPVVAVQVTAEQNGSRCAKYMGNATRFVAENLVIPSSKFLYDHQALFASAAVVAALIMYKDAPDAAPFTEKNMAAYSKMIQAFLPVVKEKLYAVAQGAYKLYAHASTMPSMPGTFFSKLDTFLFTPNAPIITSTPPSVWQTICPWCS
jgi:hypothetical protein